MPLTGPERDDVCEAFLLILNSVRMKRGSYNSPCFYFLELGEGLYKDSN